MCVNVVLIAHLILAAGEQQKALSTLDVRCGSHCTYLSLKALDLLLAPSMSSSRDLESRAVVVILFLIFNWRRSKQARIRS